MKKITILTALMFTIMSFAILAESTVTMSYRCANAFVVDDNVTGSKSSPIWKVIVPEALREA